MHADEVPVDVDRVRRLLAAQHPQWATLPIAPVTSSGTDHALFRLGDELCVRLPRVASAAAQVDKERAWLPRLAPRLPLAIPAPRAIGAPGDGHPWGWSVQRWLPGVDAATASIRDDVEAAGALGAFVVALRACDASGAPPHGAHNFGRGAPLADRDDAVRAALAALRDGDGVDVDAARAAWHEARSTPPHAGAPTWVHGDLAPGNLLVDGGRLSAVIDFGGLAVGDPAVDVMAAWTVFDGAARDAFRAAIACDDATWARGRGWALSVALIQIPYYRQTNRALVGHARRTIDAVVGRAARR